MTSTSSAQDVNETNDDFIVVQSKRQQQQRRRRETLPMDSKDLCDHYYPNKCCQRFIESENGIHTCSSCLNHHFDLTKPQKEKVLKLMKHVLCKYGAECPIQREMSLKSTFSSIKENPCARFHCFNEIHLKATTKFQPNLEWLKKLRYVETLRYTSNHLLALMRHENDKVEVLVMFIPRALKNHVHRWNIKKWNLILQNHEYSYHTTTPPNTVTMEYFINPTKEMIELNRDSWIRESLLNPFSKKRHIVGTSSSSSINFSEEPQHVFPIQHVPSHEICHSGIHVEYAYVDGIKMRMQYGCLPSIQYLVNTNHWHQIGSTICLSPKDFVQIEVIWTRHVPKGLQSQDESDAESILSDLTVSTQKSSIKSNRQKFERPIWVEEIFDGKSEVSRVLLRQKEYVVIADPNKWLMTTGPLTEFPYLVVFFKGSTLLDVRNVRKEHLKSLRNAAEEAIGLLISSRCSHTPGKPSDVHCFFHYPPQYYALHMHVCYKFDTRCPLPGVDKANSISVGLDQVLKAVEMHGKWTQHRV